MLKRRTQPMTDGKRLQTTKPKLESWSKNVTKKRQTVLFIAKKQKPLCHFAHVVIPGRCETHKRVKQRNYKNCAKKFLGC